ncbi:MAG: T9SS type A sorting domain-containing protein [Bacteroidia bacterium]|jgi:hypothetical protein|nr:T9SS type A sorting domain-containing protein [Bacteroidia bacterium]
MTLRFLKGYILVFFLLALQLLRAQTNISGTINTATGVNGIAGSAITVVSNTGFIAGDRVLLIQMKGATMNTTNTSACGTVTALNNAGNYEFGIVASVTGGTTVTLTAAPTRSYTPGAANDVQLVRVPVYNSNVNVNGNVTASAWNGTSGGVIALVVNGTLTINSGFRIDASSLGFRGGVIPGTSNGSAWCNFTDFRAANTTTPCYEYIYGQKGEGIAEDAPNDYGRGPQANGGGGAGEHNAGGGGGSNASAGGMGGRQLTNCTYRRNNTGASCATSPTASGPLQTDNCVPADINSTTGVMAGGLGGVALTTGSSNNRIFFGGGGGSGQQNGPGGTNGAAGGGIIIIVANTITNNSGFTDAIRANGGTPANTTGNEGAGGGGGGGVVLIQVNTFSNAITVAARGGNGGNAATSNNVCRGPGGGGGGGLVWIMGPSTPANLTTDVTSGASGTMVCTVPAQCGGSTAATTLPCITAGNGVSNCGTASPAAGITQLQLLLPLAVHWLEFTAEPVNRTAFLQWTTASEENNARFDILRSADGLEWVKVGQTAGAGNSSQPQYYSFTDAAPLPGLSWYRLRQVDYSGQSSLSEVRTVQFPLADVPADILLFPNPLSPEQQLILEYNRDNAPDQIIITDVSGREVRSISPLPNGERRIIINLEQHSVAPGVYVFTAVFGGERISRKLVIQ